jgi:hypothetical protein
MLAFRLWNAMETEIEATAAATQIQTRKTFLDVVTKDASTALSDLPNALQDSVHYPAYSLILPCQTVLNNFAVKDNLIWNVSYLVTEYGKVYWNDGGQYESTCFFGASDGGDVTFDSYAQYGPQTPPLNADGTTVFDYRLSLPLYLWAIAVFLLIGRALDPQFLTSRKADIAQASDTLKWLYDKILVSGNGLTPLCPPDWSASTLREVACPWPVNGEPPTPPAIRLMYGAWNPRAAGAPPFPPIVGVVFEYGAVEKYSGNSSIGDSYQVNFGVQIQSPADGQHPELLKKLQVRALKRTKDVYVSCGLFTVWQTINQLNALIGDPALSTPACQWPDGSTMNLAGWSSRQLFHLTAVPRSASGYSLRALGKFLIETPPFDTPYSAGAKSFSVKNLLTSFSD